MCVSVRLVKVEAGGIEPPWRKSEKLRSYGTLRADMVLGGYHAGRPNLLIFPHRWTPFLEPFQAAPQYPSGQSAPLDVGHCTIKVALSSSRTDEGWRVAAWAWAKGTR